MQSLNVGLLQDFYWSVILASVSYTIISADFLGYFELFVDIHQFPDTTDHIWQVAGCWSLGYSNQWQEDQIFATIGRFSRDNLWSDTRGSRAGIHASQIHYCDDKTTNFSEIPPSTIRKTGCSTASFSSHDKEWQVRFKVPRASSKSDRSRCMCEDYPTLNNIIKPNRHPHPNLLDFNSQLHGCTVYSKLNVQCKFYQICIAAADIKKAAVIIVFGLFEHRTMLLGL